MTNYSSLAAVIVHHIGSQETKAKIEWPTKVGMMTTTAFDQMDPLP
jgi:hypothetical protein